MIELVDKVKDICEEFGEGFFKGNHFIIGNIKLKYYYNKGQVNERIKVIEGKKKFLIM